MVLQGMHPTWGPVSLGLTVLGLLWYLYFGLVLGHPTDVGVYSITAMLLGSGLFGLWASKHMDQGGA